MTTDEKLSRLTAADFYPKWAGEHWMDDHSMVKNFDDWLEFAEAYAQEWKVELCLHRSLCDDQQELLRRAAELLRSVVDIAIYTGKEDWEKQRDQWLRDAGVEGK